MDNQKQQIVDKLKDANNILVTVSSSPSVDQLAACIGLTLLLNKLKKHATAVFSGEIPSTIEFLQPESTIEKNTDSLRDFIISLDKAKADKLRYKVEENVVKIFITPYKTSISQDDLDFSQGDFNVDVVLALGVHEQKDLDQAITAHGRILHDAVVASINTLPNSELGSINWTVTEASSLSELVSELAESLGAELLDSQVATALLTGIVAETGRFSNEKTSPETMRLSAELMSAGANQQLVATKLQEGSTGAATSVNSTGGEPSETSQASSDGALEITHPSAEPVVEEAQTPEVVAEEVPAPEQPDPAPQEATEIMAPPSVVGMPKRMTDAPSTGGLLTANSRPEDLEPSTDPLSLPEVEGPMLTHDHAEEARIIMPPAPDPAAPVLPKAEEIFTPEPTPVEAPQPPAEPHFEPKVPASPVAPETLVDIERAVQSPHVTASEPALPVVEPAQEDASSQIHIDEQGNLVNPELAAPSEVATEQPSPDVDSARSAVMDAINSAPAEDKPLEPTAASGAGGYLNVQDQQQDATLQPPMPPEPPVPPEVMNTAPAADTGNEPAPGLGPADQPMDMPLPPTMPLPSTPAPTQPSVNDPTAPPPVPPPMMPPGFINPSQG